MVLHVWSGNIAHGSTCVVWEHCTWFYMCGLGTLHMVLHVWSGNIAHGSTCAKSVIHRHLKGALFLIKKNRVIMAKFMGGSCRPCPPAQVWPVKFIMTQTSSVTVDWMGRTSDNSSSPVQLLPCL